MNKPMARKTAGRLNRDGAYNKAFLEIERCLDASFLKQFDAIF